ncbi:neurobeachin/beige protein [Trypanosoma rangeli]|uniref:Neurobeachin/beige protein n=1 Tax=Trypanosoma rangeli TaxID=5698 RepID=A0A3R7RL17_TRYRA|nr:neurobeachin/beige protein [Trypanosoma rangeli]RNF06294.1 neurobeachin/beige protein [Trypanosoma rangeli]|eukprot:RNF06294.1 neurobeachin/beige protein [Trypanosoma rangeli]
MFKFFAVTRKLIGGHDDTTRRPQEREDEKDAAAAAAAAEDAAEFTRFLSLPSSEGICLELEKLESRCESSSHANSYSSDTGLEGSVLKLLRGESSQPALPARLLTLLLQRLEYACVHFEEREFADFLQDSLLALHAILMTDEARFGSMMLKLGIDRQLLLVLQFVYTNLMGRITAWTNTTAITTVPDTDIPLESQIETPFDARTSCFSNTMLQTNFLRRGTMIRILHETMQLLLTLHFGTTSTAAGATGISPRSGNEGADPLSSGQHHLEVFDNATIAFFPHHRDGIWGFQCRRSFSVLRGNAERVWTSFFVSLKRCARPKCAR